MQSDLRDLDRSPLAADDSLILVFTSMLLRSWNPE
jgi:hypothetical protein